MGTELILRLHTDLFRLIKLGEGREKDERGEKGRRGEGSEEEERRGE